MKKVEIKGLGNSYNPMQDIKKNQQPAAGAEEAKKADKLELSNEAKILQAKNQNIRDLSQVEQKIKDNFYNSEAVINKTAEQILKSFKM